MQRILLFDIDNTLFDTSMFKNITNHKLFLLLGKRKESYEAVVKEYSDTWHSSSDFNISQYLSILVDKVGLKKDQIEDIFINDISNYTKSLYPEVTKVLEFLSRNNVLGIFSEGYTFYQKNKLIKSGIIGYFDKQHIFIKRKKILSNKQVLQNRLYTIIDDKLEVLKKISIPDRIWLNRNTPYKHTFIPTIHSLNELSVLIK